jgi:hypothetical protein
MFGFMGMFVEIFFIQLYDKGPDILIRAKAAFPGGVERANIVSLKLTINILQINRSSQQVHTFKSCDHVIWIVFKLMVRFF